MDTALLRAFAAVAHAGSFAAAARAAGVDPSSMSRQVAALEAAVGVRLVERTTRRLALTEAGRLYLERVRPLLDGLDEAADAARDAVAAPSGLLRVTASVAFAERWLMPRLATFRAAHPGVELDLMLSDGRLDLAAEGVDLALRLGPRPRDGSEVVSRLMATPYRVVAAPRYLERRGRPGAPADLADHAGLSFRLPSFRGAWRFRARPDAPVEAVAPPPPVLSASNALVLRRAALDGWGVALMADWTVGEDVAEGRLVDLFPGLEVSAGEFDAAAWIVYLSRAYVPARMRALIDHLRP